MPPVDDMAEPFEASSSESAACLTRSAFLQVLLVLTSLGMVRQTTEPKRRLTITKRGFVCNQNQSLSQLVTDTIENWSLVLRCVYKRVTFKPGNTQNLAIRCSFHQ